MRKVLAIVFVAVFVCSSFGVIAAGQKEAKEGAEAGGATAAKVEPVIKDEYNIAFMVKAHGAPWYVALQDAVVDEAKKIAQENNVVINVSTQECRYSGELLVEYMRTARMKKVDAMIIMAPDAFTAIPEVIEANKANIPIFTVMEKILGGDITSYVSYDNVEVGREAARFLAKKLTERYGKPEGLVAELLGNLGSSPTQDRNKGFREELKNYPGIKVIAAQPFDYDADKAITAFTNILQGNPKIDALFTHSDEGIQGALAAMKSMGRFYPVGDPKHIYCIAADAPDVGLQQIRANEQDASIELSPPKLGRIATRQAWDYLRKGIVPQKETMVPWVMIDTPKKAEDPNLWGNLYTYGKM